MRPSSLGRRSKNKRGQNVGTDSTRAQVKTLQRIRGVYTPDAAAEKLELLRSLQHRAIHQAWLLKSFHQSICFIRAFPDSLLHSKAARYALNRFVERVESLDTDGRDALADSGIEGTFVYYRFSYEVALWLMRHCPDEVEVDWQEFENFERLDEILRQIVLPGESDYYQSDRVSERKWIARAKGGHKITDFVWLMEQLRKRRAIQRFWTEMYDAVDFPLSWRLGPDFAKGRNVLMLDTIKSRGRGMRRLKESAIGEVARPLRGIRCLTRPQGARAIATAMGALAARHRETYHFNHANPAEVYAADVGQGVQILVYGLLPEYRFSLETTMGYLILANGMPVGYGGASAIFHQANTGINIFEEYRGSEAAYLWGQVLRTYHHLFGCRHFVINSYQIGAGNTEALRSGAFWFYYRLGFRPVAHDIARLASSENAKIEAGRNYRTDVKTLKRLTHCDMHLRVKGARKHEFFEERWLETCAAGATEILARQNTLERLAAAREAATELLRALGQKTYTHWSKNEQQALLQQAPIMSLLPDVKRWTKTERGNLIDLMRAKGGKFERDYIKIMRKHDRLRRSLASYCRNRGV